MSDCEFCSSYKTYNQIYAFRKNHPEYYGNERLYHEITVAMVVRSWLKGRKRTAGRTTDYRYRGCGYKLNYCPECGRRLNEQAS